MSESLTCKQYFPQLLTSMDIIWDPQVIQHINESDMRLYLEFSSTACVPGGGCDVEQALQVLYDCNGDIKLAMKQLLSNQRVGPSSWTDDEIHQFGELFTLHGKDFTKISQQLQTRSLSECVKFYYLWKKSPLRHLTQPNWTSRNSSSTTTSTISSPSTLSSSLLSTATMSSSSSPSESIQSTLTSTTATNIIDNETKFPCRVCGRVFEKVKSRSAHMKRHKNERWR